jgi:hypothetical protein
MKSRYEEVVDMLKKIALDQARDKKVVDTEYKKLLDKISQGTKKWQK